MIHPKRKRSILRLFINSYIDRKGAHLHFTSFPIEPVSKRKKKTKKRRREYFEVNMSWIQFLTVYRFTSIRSI